MELALCCHISVFAKQVLLMTTSFANWVCSNFKHRRMIFCEYREPTGSQEYSF
jgi:hypothetical protein